MFRGTAIGQLQHLEGAGREGIAGKETTMGGSTTHRTAA
jgi:hypothetical protein